MIQECSAAFSSTTMRSAPTPAALASAASAIPAGPAPTMSRSNSGGDESDGLSFSNASSNAGCYRSRTAAQAGQIALLPSRSRVRSGVGGGSNEADLRGDVPSTWDLAHRLGTQHLPDDFRCP